MTEDDAKKIVAAITDSGNREKFPVFARIRPVIDTSKEGCFLWIFYDERGYTGRHIMGGFDQSLRVMGIRLAHWETRCHPDPEIYPSEKLAIKNLYDKNNEYRGR